MLCEKCNKQEATIFFSEVKVQQKIEHHLCESCYQAEKQSIQSPSFAYSPDAVAKKLVEVLMDGIPKQAIKDYFNRTCPHCGLIYQEFQETGLFGCPHDYELFGNSLPTYYRQFADSATHQGKVPPTKIKGEQPVTTDTKGKKIVEEQINLATTEQDAEQKDKPLEGLSLPTDPFVTSDQKSNLELLREQLQEAIAKEDYEKAAIINQKIRNLESTSHGHV